MKSVKEISKLIEGTIITNFEKADREFKGIVASDLLSYVMANSSEDYGIVTVLSNINVLGVAVLIDSSCVIISSGIKVNAQITSKAEEEGIILITSNLTTYEICGRVYEILKND